jgi:energy-coupling factor transporter transmembrane protein EcfT
MALIAVRDASSRGGAASSLDPACRLICLALLSSSSLIASLPFSACIALAAFGLLKLEGAGFARMLGESVFVLVFALGAAMLRLLAWDGESSAATSLVVESAVYGMKLLAAFLLGRLFYASTSQGELRDAATRIARHIPFLRRFDVGLSLSLVLGYIPLIFAEWRDSLEAARSRGMPRRPSIAQLTLFLAAFMRRLMMRAVAVPHALTARGWSRDRGLAASRWKLRDTVVATLSSGAFVGAILKLV